MNPLPSSDSTITHEMQDDSLLDEIVDQSSLDARNQNGVWLAKIVDKDASGLPIVEIMDSGFAADAPMLAQAICPLADLEVGQQCAVSMTCGNQPTAIVLGRLQSTVFGLGDTADIRVSQENGTVDIQAEGEISLQCGKASLRMTSAGLVEIRGKKVVTHSTGLNRIRGASVKLN